MWRTPTPESASMMEDIRFDDSGQLLTGSFHGLRHARASDLPAVAVESNPVPTKTNPLASGRRRGRAVSARCRRVTNAYRRRALRRRRAPHPTCRRRPRRVWRRAGGGCVTGGGRYALFNLSRRERSAPSSWLRFQQMRARVIAVGALLMPLPGRAAGVRGFLSRPPPCR